MAATPATYEDVMKEVWTQDRLEKQFHAGDTILDQIEKTSRYKVGNVALVPTHMDRSGGYTIVPPQGASALNGGDKQKMDRAEYNYTRHWFEVEIDTAALKRTEGPLAVASALDTEITGGIEDMKHQLSAQVYGDGTGVLAVCKSNNSATVLELGDGGKWAIERGFLYPGLKIDIGTDAAPSTIASKKAILAVDPSTPSITVADAVTTTTSHKVTIAGSRVNATTFYGMNGLGNLIGTGTFGGLSSSTYFRWQSSVTGTAGDLTLEKLLKMRTAIKGSSGSRPDWNVCSPTQEYLFYLLLQTQARFDGDKGIGAGDTDKVKWSGMTIDAQDDCPDTVWYMLTKKNLFAVRLDKPYWVTQEHGGSILQYKPNTTFVAGAAEYMIQLATNKRSAFGKLTGLSTVAPSP